MFKIVSDPTRYPVHEIDLSHEAGTLNFVPNTAINSFDLLFDRPDGGKHVYGRKGRSVFDLAITHGLAEDDYKSLVRLRDGGNTVYVFPDFDKRTQFYAPLSKSTKALQFDPVNKKWAYDSGTFTGNNAETYAIDGEGNYSLIAANTPRFSSSAIGNGIYLTNSASNLCSTPHPTASDVLLSGLTSAVNVSFMDQTYGVSPAPTFSGVGRLQVDANAGVVNGVIDATSSATANKWYNCTFKVRGRGTIAPVLQDISGTSTTGSLDFLTYLSEDWQQIKMKVYKTTADTTMRIKIAIFNATFDQFCDFGPVSIQVTSTGGGEFENIPDWIGGNFGIGDLANEYLYYDAYQTALPGDGMSISVVGVVPDNQTNCNIFRADGSSNNRLSWDPTSSGILFTYAGDTFSLTIADWSSQEGKDYWLCVRQDTVLTTQSIKIDAYIDGTSYSASFTPTALDIPNRTVPSVLKVGGATGSVSRSSGAKLQFLRIDNKAWTDDETVLHRKMFTESAYRNMLMMTTGKKFIISSINLSPTPRSSGWDLMTGSITLTEVGQDADMEIGF